jgi:putative tricarboxylic transport membrane protein
VRVASIILTLVTFAVLLTPLGFKLVMLALLLGLFFAYDREHVLAKIGMAVAASVGTHYVFSHYLRVPLPDASLPALRALGF